jgi:MFS family permease
VGVWVGIAAGGGIIGLFVAGVLLQFFAWNSFFAFNVVMAIIAIVGASLIVPKNRDESRHGLDGFGAVLSLLTVGGLVFGIIEGPSRGWTDAGTLTALIVGVLAGVAFVLWELRQKYPLLDPRLFKLRGLSTGTLSILLQFFTAFGFFFIGMQYLQFIAGLTPLMAAVCLLPMPFFVIPISRVSAMIAERRGFGVVSPIGLVLMACGYLVFATMGVDFQYWQLLIGIALFASGMGFAGPPATTAIISSLPREKQGVASAMNDTSREVGSALGIAVLGSILSQSYTDAMKPAVAGLPDAVANFVSSSIAWVNTDLVGKLGPAAPKLINTAKQAYVDGIHTAFWLSAAVLVIAAIFVAIRAPRRTK